MAHRLESADPTEAKAVAAVDKAYVTSNRQLSIDVSLEDAIATEIRKGIVVNARGSASSILTKHAELVATVDAVRSSGSLPQTLLYYTLLATAVFRTPVGGGKSPATPDALTATPVTTVFRIPVRGGKTPAAPVSERELDTALAEGVTMMREDKVDLSALDPALTAIARDTRADLIVGGSFVASVFAQAVPNAFTLPYNDIDVYKGGFEIAAEYERVAYATKDLGLPKPVLYIACVGLAMSRLAIGVDLNLVDGRFHVKEKQMWHFLLREHRAIRAINSATPAQKCIRAAHKGMQTGFGVCV